MAKLDLLRGTIRGRFGQFVGSSWKGKHYVKLFGKPGNPRTEDQVAVRTVFKNVSHIAKSIYGGVLKPYTFPKPKRHSAYNRMIKANKAMFSAKAWEPEKLKIFEGPLPNPGISDCYLDFPGQPAEQIAVEWETLSGDPSDAAIAVVYDEACGKTLFGMSKRGAKAMVILSGALAPIDKSKTHVYLVFAKPPAEGTAEAGQVSGTAYSKIE